MLVKVQEGDLSALEKIEKLKKQWLELLPKNKRFRTELNHFFILFFLEKVISLSIKLKILESSLLLLFGRNANLKNNQIRRRKKLYKI